VRDKLNAAHVRPSDPGWPSDAAWEELNRQVEGRLMKVQSALIAPSGAACAQSFKDLKNPYYLGDEVRLTRSVGWVGAWTSRPSVYPVANALTNTALFWAPKGGGAGFGVVTRVTLRGARGRDQHSSRSFVSR
jgi:hypothetical protein